MTDKLAILKRWATAIEQADAHFDAVTALMGLYPESPTRTAVYELQAALTQATADLVDDADGWLEWYWLENDMGQRGHEAAPHGGQLRAVRTLDDLLGVMG